MKGKGSGEVASASDLSPRPEAFERPETTAAPGPTEDYIPKYSEESLPETPPYLIGAEAKLRNPLWAYGEAIGRYSLLTDDQEFEYGSQLRQSRLAAERLAADKDIPDGVTISGLKHQVAQGLRAKELLLRHNLRLPFALACRYSYREDDAFECIQVGNEELLRTIDEFDPQRGKRVSRIANPRVAGVIIRHVTRANFSVRPPDKIFKKAQALDALRDPTSDMTREDFAKAARVKLKGVDKVIATNEQFLVQFGNKSSLDAAIEATKSRTITLEDMLSQSTFPEPGENSLWLLAEELLLPEERFVLRLRIEFGMEYKEIGVLLHRPRQSVRDIYLRAIKKLRETVA